jgi:2'-5' RNA ligase
VPASVVCAAFDADGDAAVATVQETLRALGVRVPRQPAHRVHITLAAASADPTQIAPIAAEVAQRHVALDVTLDRVGTFARGSVVWLGPSDDDVLSALQRDVNDALAGHPSAFGEQTDPRHWVAHCTLARRTTARIADRLRASYHPITVRVDALATIVVGGRGDIALAPLAHRPVSP